MAKKKYVVAGIENYVSGKGEQGVRLGEFREIKFAEQAYESILREARKKGWAGHCGIFLNGKLVKAL